MEQQQQAEDSKSARRPRRFIPIMFQYILLYCLSVPDWCKVSLGDMGGLRVGGVARKRDPLWKKITCMIRILWKELLYVCLAVFFQRWATLFWIQLQRELYIYTITYICNTHYYCHTTCSTYYCMQRRRRAPVISHAKRLWRCKVFLGALVGLLSRESTGFPSPTFDTQQLCCHQ